MSVDTRQLEKFAKQLAKAGADMNEVRREIIQKEAQSVVTRAKLICTKEKIVDTGYFRNNFHAQKAVVSDGNASCVVGNNVEYASFVEYGHLAVGKGTAEMLQNRRRNAMNSGRYVRGRYVLTKAMQDTLRTQKARIYKRLRRIYDNL